MSIDKEQANLAQVKMNLAKKYMNLAKVVNSKPRRKKWLNQAKRFRRQAEEILESLK